MRVARTLPDVAFRHPKIRQIDFGGRWGLNHLRDLQNFKTSAKLSLSPSIRGMVDLCSSKEKVWRCDIRREVGSGNPKKNSAPLKKSLVGGPREYTDVVRR